MESRRREDNNAISLREKIEILDALKQFIGSFLRAPAKNHIQQLLSPHLPHESIEMLYNLVDSPETDSKKRVAVLVKVFPDIKLLGDINVKMEKTSDTEEQIKFLAQALDHLQLLPQDVPILMNENLSSSVIQFFLDHDSCTTMHVVFYFLTYKNHPDFYTQLVKHPKFPATQEKLIECCRAFDLFCDPIIHNRNHYRSLISSDGYLSFLNFHMLKIFLENAPQLIHSQDIRRGIHQLYTAYADREDINLDPLESYTLLLLCEHSAFPLDFETSQEAIHLAVKYNLKVIVNFFLFYSNMAEPRKYQLMQRLVAWNKMDLLEDISFKLSDSYLETSLLTFYMSMMNSDLLVQNKDVIFYIIDMIRLTGMAECKSSLLSSYQPPGHYMSTGLTLFKRNYLYLETILNLANIGIQKYLDEDPSLKGLRRALNLQGFISGSSTIDLKILALYSILHENTSFRSTIKSHLRAALNEYLDLIDLEAERYAQELNLDLKVLKDNFVELIHRQDGLTILLSPKGFFIQCLHNNAEIKMSNLPK